MSIVDLPPELTQPSSFHVLTQGLASPISYPKASGGVTSEDGVEAALRLVPQQIWPIFLW